jgi:hypothetical protein
MGSGIEVVFARGTNNTENFIVFERPVPAYSETPRSQIHRCRSQNRKSSGAGTLRHTRSPRMCAGSHPKPRII